MKKNNLSKHWMILSAQVLCAAASTYAAVPTFGERTAFFSPSDTMTAQANWSPCITDINGDGLPDILAGCFDSGRVVQLLNDGTKNAPSFSIGPDLSADGAVISLPFG